MRGQHATGPSASVSRRCRALISFTDRVDAGAAAAAAAAAATSSPSASSASPTRSLLAGGGGSAGAGASASGERHLWSAGSSSRGEAEEAASHAGGRAAAPPFVHRFLAGTADLGASSSSGGGITPAALGGGGGPPNALVLLEYDEESRVVQPVASPFAHEAGDVWSLAARPVLNVDDSRAVLSCFLSRKAVRGLSLTTVQGSRASTARVVVEGSEGAWCAAWDKRGERAVSGHEDGGLRVWRTRDGEHLAQEAAAVPPTSAPGLGEGEVREVAWDLLHEDLVVLARGAGAVGVDARDPTAAAFEIATGSKCRTLDVNPNRPHFLLTAGEEGALRFWDSRKTAQPVQSLSRGGHSHWITKARFNPFHDQLVLTSSTDGLVCLWRATSVSSAPLSADADLALGLDDDPLGQLDASANDDDGARALNLARLRAASLHRSEQDGLVRAYDEHRSESVYAVAWSAVDAWTFASISYDGKFFVRNVPSAEKYKIILL